MKRPEFLAESVLHSRGLLSRYLVGFDDSNHTVTAPGLPNHLAWILGHCALTMHRAAERVDGRERLDGSFIPDAGTGDGRRFGAESVAFGSDPRATGVTFPGHLRCAEIFADATERLASALRQAPEPSLDELVLFFGGVALPRWMVAPRIIFHNGMHCGQIADLRRALGLKPIFA